MAGTLLDILVRLKLNWSKGAGSVLKNLNDHRLL